MKKINIYKEKVKEVFDYIKPLEFIPCMYKLSAETMRDIVKIVMEKNKHKRRKNKNAKSL